jgi:glycosyltransferase involved in cell wall biosynthesis
MKKINFITNIAPGEAGGGMSAVSYSTHQQLKRFFDVNYVGPIPFPDFKMEHYASKAARVLGMKGKYFFFSDRRLQAIADDIHQRIDGSGADYNFFHGFTPWINFNSSTPYFAYCDACFDTYVRLYNKMSEFSARDLQRICHREKEWLQNARLVFFHSEWAMEETKKVYGMKGEHFRSPGFGGFIDKIPGEDRYAGGHNIMFISRQFAAKGGMDSFNALKRINEQYPEVTLTILGEQPPAEVLSYPQVNYVGFLRKSVPEEFARYKELLESAWLLMHPTTRDVNPLVLAEAGYYGCPSLATRSFAIPELVKDRETGFLIDAPVRVEDIVNILKSIMQDKQAYLEMRKAAKIYTTAKLSWTRVGDNLYKEITA